MSESFKAMGREPRPWVWDWFGVSRSQSVVCEKCGGQVYAGDWPFCRGNPMDHLRD